MRPPFAFALAFVLALACGLAIAFLVGPESLGG